ncbi:MAG TPA: hypothetical protein VJ914_10505 [Pseudonocardiaceae bacterium]|nr:hypothetical protein [Pseudonocardiaceae bacterium]
MDDGEVAAAAYGEAERRYESKMHGNGEVDVLLVGASNLEVVKAQYPSYLLADLRTVPI